MMTTFYIFINGKSSQHTMRSVVEVSCEAYIKQRSNGETLTCSFSLQKQ